MFCRGVPVSLGNAQTFVDSSHFASGVNARTSRRRAELIEDVLAQTLLRVFAKSREESFEPLVSRQAMNEIIHHQSDRVITTESCVKRLLLLGANRFRLNN